MDKFVNLTLKMPVKSDETNGDTQETNESLAQYPPNQLRPIFPIQNPPRPQIGNGSNIFWYLEISPSQTFLDAVLLYQMRNDGVKVKQFLGNARYIPYDDRYEIQPARSLLPMILSCPKLLILDFKIIEEIFEYPSFEARYFGAYLYHHCPRIRSFVNVQANHLSIVSSYADMALTKGFADQVLRVDMASLYEFAVCYGTTLNIFNMKLHSVTSMTFIPPDDCIVDFNNDSNGIDPTFENIGRRLRSFTYRKKKEIGEVNDIEYIQLCKLLNSLCSSFMPQVEGGDQAIANNEDGEQQDEDYEMNTESEIFCCFISDRRLSHNTLEGLEYQNQSKRAIGMFFSRLLELSAPLENDLLSCLTGHCEQLVSFGQRNRVPQSLTNLREMKHLKYLLILAPIIAEQVDDVKFFFDNYGKKLNTLRITLCSHTKSLLSDIASNSSELIQLDLQFEEKSVFTFNNSRFITSKILQMQSLKIVRLRGKFLEDLDLNLITNRGIHVKLLKKDSNPGVHNNGEYV